MISPAPTHAEIASRISTHREAVTRELNSLARAKLIEKRGTTLVIREIAALTRLVEDALEEPCWGITLTNGGRDLSSTLDRPRALPTPAVSGSLLPTRRLAVGNSLARRF